MLSETDPEYDSMKKKERKVGFLYMELQDIKNNKGTMTLQVKSTDHLQSWIKKNQKLQSELSFQPVDIKAEMVEKSLLNDASIQQKWWLQESEQKKSKESSFQKPKDFKSESKQTNDILELAKNQRMNTDIKKAVFQAIVGSEDYI